MIYLAEAKVALMSPLHVMFISDSQVKTIFTIGSHSLPYEIVFLTQLPKKDWVRDLKGIGFDKQI